MDPPGEHEKSKRKGLFGRRQRSKGEPPQTGCAAAAAANFSDGGGSSSNSRRDAPSSGSDDSYVKVRKNAKHSVKISAPDDIIRQQERILEESKKRVQQEHQKQQKYEEQQEQPRSRMEPPPLVSSGSSSSLMCRKSLHRKAPSLSTYQLTPITKHYEISRQILAAFDSHWSNHLWVTAYAVGMQYVETALLEIPKHGYFYSKRHERERMENSLEAARVAHLLQTLLLEQEQEPALPDEKGLAEPTAGLVPAGDLERVQKLLNMAMEQVEQASDDQAKHQHAREKVEEELRYSLQEQQDEPVTTTSDWIVCGGGGTAAAAEADDSATAAGEASIFSVCSDRLSSVFQGASAVDDGKSVVTSTRSIINMGGDTMATRGTNSSRSLIRGELSSIPGQTSASVLIDEPPPSADTRPPLPPSMSRSTASFVSHHSRHQTSEDMLLEKALFLTGLEVSEATVVGHQEEERVPPPSYEKATAAAPPVQRLRESAAILELSTLSMLYHEDFDSLQKSRRVRISFADTYQGRLADSTNGCTVIAPLLCMHHLTSCLIDYLYDESGGDPGLPDSAIVQCIDTDTPNVLLPLRQQLGLSEHAFLIPVDAHDYLIEKGLLSQDQFHSVIGGNILDDSHLNAFVSALEEVKDRKAASTLFFHEHVVAIFKLKRTNSTGTVTWWYDVIDSLPLKKTFCRTEESAVRLCQRLGIFNDLTEAEMAEETEMTTLPKTARIRCLDAEALIAVIRWYACSKFNDEDMAYIDQYPWDDSAHDFDPRVFQSFIWQGVAFENDPRTAAGKYSSLSSF